MRYLLQTSLMVSFLAYGVFFFSNTGLHSDPLLHKVELAIRLSIPEGSEGVPV